jgi:phenylacetyl-CoA:acceptor oxidoreductase
LGPIDFSFGSGQGVKCYHSEHLYGELWHRAFTVCPDTPNTKYVVSFGSNIEASGGVCAVWRHAEGRVRGIKRVQVEPHLSITGACSAEWVPIKPKTDPAFMFAMINVLLHEHKVDELDIPYLRDRTSSPYLIGPNGYFLRHPESHKPLLWDKKTNGAVPFDTQGTEPELIGRFKVKAIEFGPDKKVLSEGEIEGVTCFSQLVEHMKEYTPEWAAGICDVPVETIRKVANEFLAHAEIGATMEIEGRVLPYRPVAITLGKTVNNGWGGFETCWSRTLLSCLVGSLEVPGGTLGTTVRLNRHPDARFKSVTTGPDGFMDYPFNPTDEENWADQPTTRNGYKMLVPLVSNSPWSQALGPTHLAWLFHDEPPKGWPKHTFPDIWFVYRTNPSISSWDTPRVTDIVSRFPFTVAFAYTKDETNHMADILLPDATDLEGLQLIRIGATKFVEQYWDHHGFALRQPMGDVKGEAKDFSWVAGELSRRTGVYDKYLNVLNKGGAGIPLSGEHFDYRLDDKRNDHSVEEIWDAVCKAASSEITKGETVKDLAWFKENGFLVEDFPRIGWYLYPTMVDMGLRFEMPYQERLFRIGKELENRLHEKGINWWDNQLHEYQFMPKWKDFPGIWEQSVVKAGKDLKEYRFWLLTSRSMQYSWGGNVGIQMIKEVADNIAGHRGSVKGLAVLRQGIRPDTMLMVGQFQHWATPFAKDFDVPSMNSLTPMEMDLTDATGSSADIVRVSLRKVGDAA